MTLLQEHIKKSREPSFGVKAYIDDVVTRFSARPSTEWAQHKEVKCFWSLQYASRTSTAVTILFLPIMMLAGHGVMWTTQVTFVTYHYLEPLELRKLEQRRKLKKLLVPLAIMGMGWAGLIAILALIIGVATYFSPPSPGDNSERIPLWAIALVLLTAMTLFAAAVWAQRRFWKLGEPQDSDCFRDQRIQLREVRIT